MTVEFGSIQNISQKLNKKIYVSFSFNFQIDYSKIHMSLPDYLSLPKMLYKSGLSIAF